MIESRPRGAPAGFALVIAGAAALTACQTQVSAGEGAAPIAGLAGTSWRLIEIASMDDTQGTQRTADPSRYTIGFQPDGQMAVRLDCNRGVGTFKSRASASDSGSLKIGPLAVTKALCPPPSLGEALERQLPYVRSYIVRDGKLYMTLMADGGILAWEPVPPNRVP